MNRTLKIRNSTAEFLTFTIQAQEDGIEVRLQENSRRVQLPSISRQLPPMGGSKKLDAFLQFNEYDLLNNIGKVSTEVAKAFAESEFEKYRVIQDRLYESDFDKALKLITEDEE